MDGGRLEVIAGPMFSGKTGELIRRLSEAVREGARVVALKSHLDDRHGAPSHLSSHDGLRFPCTTLGLAAEIGVAAAGASVVGVDEAQFIGGDVAEACRALVGAGSRVIVAGLDQDFRGVAFDPFPALRVVADEVVLLTATCAVCGGVATHTYRTAPGTERVLVGAEDAYEPRCGRCFSAGSEHVLRPREQDPEHESAVPRNRA